MPRASLSPLAAALLALSLAGPVLAQAPAPRVEALVGDTQRIRQGAGIFQMVWWIPTDYWRASFEQTPNMTAEQKETFYRAVDDYIVLSVIDAKLSDLGSVTPASREDIGRGLALQLGPGPTLAPLTDGEVSGDARNLFGMMKPVMANALGQFGQGLEFFYFRATGADGKRLLDPRAPGAFVVRMGGNDFQWRLPLGSLLPAAFDPKTGEEFPGNFLFSPFTGNRLTNRPPAP